MTLFSKSKNICHRNNSIFCLITQSISQHSVLYRSLFCSVALQEFAEFSPGCCAEPAIPFHHCIIIMSSCIEDHIFHIMENISGIFSTCFNREKEDLHSLQMVMILQGKYFRAKISQILSHQVQSRNLLLQNIDNLITRCLNPLPFNGSRTGSRNLPVCVK